MRQLSAFCLLSLKCFVLYWHVKFQGRILAFKTVDISKNSDRIFVAGDEYEHESATIGEKITRFLVSAIFLSIIGYGFIYYLPAYFNYASALGFSVDKQESLPAIPAGSTQKSTGDKLFKIRSGYLRAGQSLKLNYSLSPGTRMTVQLGQCTAPIFLNVMNCNSTQASTIDITGTGPGATKFMVRNDGFYSFQEYVVDASGEPTTAPYLVKWYRKEAKPKTN